MNGHSTESDSKLYSVPRKVSIKHRLIDVINLLLQPLDAQIVRRSLFNTLLSSHNSAKTLMAHALPPSPSESEIPDELCLRPSYHDSPLPEEALSYLQQDNTRLLDLVKRYKALSLPVTTSSLWSDQFQQDGIDLRYFRGDDAFIWQYRGYKNRTVAELRYLLSTYYIESIDKLGLLKVLSEDNLFGVYTFDYNQRFLISRDLLDSILEIYFLEEHMGISQRPGMNILDIGAGYGRLAHRMVKAFPGLGKFFCTDAIAISTFISEYYLRFRGVEDKAIVIPLDEIDTTLSNSYIDLAVNIHSFSECTLDAICWWLDILKKYKVSYLMVVPNDGPVLLSREPDGTHQEFQPEIEARGYQVLASDPKFKDSVLQQYGIYPAQYYLFKANFSD